MSEQITETEQNAVPTENPIITETLKLVEASQSQSVFNLSEVVKGRGYPSKNAVIYLDGEAAFELAELNNEMNRFHSEEELAEMQKRAEALAEKVKKSAVTFVMRGVSQKIVEDVITKTNEKYPPEKGRNEASDNPEWVKYYIANLVALNIVKIIDNDGNVDGQVYTPEMLLDIRDSIPADAWNVLVETMQKLTLASGYFDELTDEGFLPRS